MPRAGFNTSADADAYMKKYYRLFTPNDFRRLKKTYPSYGDTDPQKTNFATTGETRPNALKISDWANGEQQRVTVR